VTAGWRAYNITSDKPTAVGAWSDNDLAAYLTTGHANGHGAASGPMGEAVVGPDRPIRSRLRSSTRLIISISIRSPSGSGDQER
jgi:hypothetical protein